MRKLQVMSRLYLWPPKTDLSQKLYIETKVRNPTKVGFFRPQVGFGVTNLKGFLSKTSGLQFTLQCRGLNSCNRVLRGR